MQLVRGQKVKLTDLTSSTVIEVGVQGQYAGSGSLDITCFGVDAANQLTDDRYFIFYNQPSSPEGAIRKLGAGAADTERFAIDLARLPATIVKLVFTAAIDGNGTLSQLSQGYLRLSAQGREVARFTFSGKDFAAEKAIIMAEIYVKDRWRLAAVGQGFNGGLAALLRHFGGEEDASAKAPPPAPAPLSRTIHLEKQVQAKAPQLLSLVKQARVSLEKAGLGDHTAKVALCLDVSGSMTSLYRSGKVQQLAERALALGCHFDDDGAIDIFLFGTDAAYAGEMSIDNFPGFIDRLKTEPAWRAVGGGTEYHRAITVIRNHYFPGASSAMRTTPLTADLPVYVMFITDGDTGNKSFTKEQITRAAYEPIFWQFMAIGKEQFQFLQRLDTLKNRYVDNAGFFSVADPSQLTDEELYRLLMTEYPDWVKLARNQQLLRSR